MHRSVLATINLPRELIRLHSYIRCRPKLHPFRATVSKTVRPMLSDPFLSACPVCNVGVLWPNSWMDHDETCFEGRPRPWPYCVRWGPSSPSPNTQRPNFRPMSVVVKRRIKMPLGREIGLGPGDIVRWGPSSRAPKGGKQPPLFDHVCCGQTAGWIKTSFATEVGLSQGDIVLDGDPASPKRAKTPTFGLCLL